MSTNIIVGDRTVALPKGWQQSSLTLYFEGEDLSQQEQPFAANVVVQLRLVAMELPNNVMPTLMVGIGPEDVAEAAKADLYGTSEPRKQRRAWSISFAPVDRTKKEEELLQNDIKRIQLGCRGKLAKVE